MYILRAPPLIYQEINNARLSFIKTGPDAVLCL